MTQTTSQTQAGNKERMAVAYQCPQCLGYSVHKASRALMRRNKELGSKAAPIRAFCPDPIGGCECEGDTTKRGRGRRQIRIASWNKDHRIAQVPIRQINRMNDLCEALNMDLRVNPDKVHTKAEMYSIVDPSWVQGMSAPLPFRLERDV